MLGFVEGRIKDQVPEKRFTKTFQGAGKMSQDLDSILVESHVEINHSKEMQQAKFIHWRREIYEGRVVLEERADTTGTEVVGPGTQSWAWLTLTSPGQSSGYGNSTAPGCLGSGEHEKISQD